MKSLIVVILLLLTTNAMAVRFDGIQVADIVNPELKSLIEKWNAEFDIWDAGSYGYQVKEMSSSGKWDKTVRQISYITSYCQDEKVAQEVPGPSFIYPDTKELIYAMSYLDLPNTERAVEALATKYSDLIEELYANDDFMILEGYSGCSAFDSGFDEITIIDTVNKQFFVLYGGYSE